MEQHKVLLIIVAVTIVLAAVIGAGIWLFYPRGDDAAENLARGPVESMGFEWEPLDYLSGEGQLPGLDQAFEEEPDEFEITYGVVEGDAGPGDEGGRTPMAPRGVDPTDIPPPSRLIVEDRPIEDQVASPVPPTSTTPPISTVSPVVDEVASAVPPTSSTPTITAETTPAADKPEITTHSYWVQVISSPNRDTAEQAKRTLGEYQLGSRILMKQIDGRTYYRLRLGPFALRAEAEKFLAWVQDIDGFSGSMIFVDYSTPTIAAAVR